MAFPIIKETGGCPETVFPFFVPVTIRFRFLRRKRKTTASQIFPTVYGFFSNGCVMSIFALCFRLKWELTTHCSVLFQSETSFPISKRNKASHFPYIFSYFKWKQEFFNLFSFSLQPKWIVFIRRNCLVFKGKRIL